MASFRSAAFGLGLLLVAACSGKDPYNPGTPLGTFHVSAKLTGSTCGAVPDPWEFDVKLAHEESTLFWIQGGAPISGEVDRTARATLKATDARELRPANARTKTAACVVSRDDVLEVALATEDPNAPVSTLDEATRFGGKLTYRFSPTQGSECSDQTLDQRRRLRRSAVRSDLRSRGHADEEASAVAWRGSVARNWRGTATEQSPRPPLPLRHPSVRLRPTTLRSDSPGMVWRKGHLPRAQQDPRTAMSPS